VPGDLKRQPFWPGGKRFWRIVREVLNLTEAVVKVDSVAALTLPVCDCLGPGMGPKTMGMRQ
jgi:hypothetical protein